MPIRRAAKQQWARGDFLEEGPIHLGLLRSTAFERKARFPEIAKAEQRHLCEQSFPSAPPSLHFVADSLTTGRRASSFCSTSGVMSKAGRLYRTAPLIRTSETPRALATSATVALRAVTTWLWAPTCICCSCWRRDIAVCRNAATFS